MEARGRSLETSPDRARMAVQGKTKLFRKAQIVYYLCRNGQLEHPHFMEISLPSNQQLRLKDAIDRLSALRGRNMPALFSWSCKRSYKNGYVWNDLAENDVIYPADGVEYVLKGSEIVEGSAERFQQLQLSTAQAHRETRLYQKPKLVLCPEPEQVQLSSGDLYSRCSRGVSTEEDENQNIATEITVDGASPSSSSSTASEKAAPSNGSSRRMDDESGAESAPTRGSVLLQFISCGSGSGKRQSGHGVRASSPARQRKGSSLHRGVLCKAARSIEEEEINYMSENPRFGNPQAEEKEYFSGSIIEDMTEEKAAGAGAGVPALKKSSSYHEERSADADDLHEEAEVTEKGRLCGMKGKCIPVKRTSTDNQAKK